MTDTEPYARSLPPGHDCRRDDPGYASVSEWYRDHIGRVPIQSAWGLDRYVKAHGCTFAEAFGALSGTGGPLILLAEQPDPQAPSTSTK